jgi:hypothetical protein
MRHTLQTFQRLTDGPRYRAVTGNRTNLLILFMAGFQLCPDNRLSWVNFHTFLHIWVTWIRRYGASIPKVWFATREYDAPVKLPRVPRVACLRICMT